MWRSQDRQSPPSSYSLVTLESGWQLQTTFASALTHPLQLHMQSPSSCNADLTWITCIQVGVKRPHAGTTCRQVTRWQVWEVLFLTEAKTLGVD